MGRYSQISNIKHTKYQSLADSRLFLALFLYNPLKPAGVKSSMKMYLEQRQNLSDQ